MILEINEFYFKKHKIQNEVQGINEDVNHQDLGKIINSLSDSFFPYIKCLFRTI